MGSITKQEDSVPGIRGKPDMFALQDEKRVAGIELLIKFAKSRVVTVLPTPNQMNWSHMELSSQ
jgi:hypothetical protein